MRSIDLNCDLGEGAGCDELLMPLITSANIACGGHAGDEATMREAVRLALAHQVRIGAHPGFSDRENFGRREITLSPAEVHQLVLSQTRALQRVAAGLGGVVTHVKPHGALYNMGARDSAVAQAIAEAVRESDPQLALVGLAGSRLIAAAGRAGLRAVGEVFADRTYQPDGSLTPRSQPNAIVHDAHCALEQVLGVLDRGEIVTACGNVIKVGAETVCVHGDGASAVEILQSLRTGLESAGVRIAPF